MDSRKRTHGTTADSTTSGPPFAIAVSRALGTVVVTVQGRLDAAGAQRLDHTLKDLIQNQGNREIVVDLKNLEVCDADAVEVFGTAYAAAVRRGAELKLSRPSSRLYRLLDSLGIAGAVPPDRSNRRLHPAGSSQPHGPQGVQRDVTPPT